MDILVTFFLLCSLLSTEVYRAGLMVETRTFQVKYNKTSWWGLVDWASFPYRTWANINTPHPYFHEEQDCHFNFEDLEDVFNFPKAVIIKTTLDVVPTNEQTKENYESLG